MFRKLIGGLVGLAFFGMTANANATLIGETVTMRHDFPNLGTTISGPINVLVQAGAGDLAEPYTYLGENWYFVDMEASSFSVVYNRAPNWANAPFNGLIISDMDWVGIPGFITGVDVSTNLAGFNNNRVTFTANSVSINWQGLSFAIGTRWDIGLQTSHKIPEPATLAFFAIGLAGLGFMMRRRRRST